ncbi:MAG TPA: PEGA domain-containing protein [Terriglobia bacterium]|nr:PEGA domain-containing protein [Terriglobia bacterium]HEU5133616.1 PEGA domain-containing protein [Steroidobacteraceae bacterium]
MILKMIAAIVTLAAMQGCATITRGTTEVLVVETQPPGADVRINPTGTNCKTPCSIELKRKRNYTLQIDRAGFEPATVNVLSEIAGAGAAGMAGNVILGGLIGVAVDAASGATKKLTPNPVKLNLVPLTVPVVESTPTPTAQPTTAIYEDYPGG